MELNKKEKQLIRKLINGTATRAELEEIQPFVKTPDGRLCFDEVMDEIGGDFKADLQAETDNVVNDKLKQFKERNNIGAKPLVVKMPLWQYAARYAAILLIAAGAAFYFFGMHGQSQQQQMPSSATVQKLKDYKTSRGQRAILTLSDGSVITLGPDTKLSYPENFTGNRRDVYLEGEAFFEVAKNPKKPFTVHSYELETRVVGTSFKIDAFRNDPLEVSVVTGKVRVSSRVNGNTTQLANMLPGDHIRWYKGQSNTGKRDIQESLAWVNNKLIFNNQALSRILSALERSYNVTINSKKLKNADEKISVTLDGRWPLNRTMNVLAATAGFKYEIKGRQVTVFLN